MKSTRRARDRDLAWRSGWTVREGIMPVRTWLASGIFAALLTALPSPLSVWPSLRAAGALAANTPAVREPQMPDLQELVKQLMPAVVNISILKERKHPAGEPAKGGDEMMMPVREVGTGFIIAPDGYIVTNRHVIADAYQLTV